MGHIGKTINLNITETQKENYLGYIRIMYLLLTRYIVFVVDIIINIFIIFYSIQL